jgi:hypothetical protein
VWAGSTEKLGKSDRGCWYSLVLILFDKSLLAFDSTRSDETYFYLSGPVAAQEPNLVVSKLRDLLQWLPPICIADLLQWLPLICSLICYSDCRQFARWFAAVIAANMYRRFAAVIAANMLADLLQWLPPICSLICCMIAANMLADLIQWLPPIWSLICYSDCRQYDSWFAAWLPPICSLIYCSDCRQYARWFAAVIAANLLADLPQWLPPICSLICCSDCRQYARWFAIVIAANMLADLLHDFRQYALVFCIGFMMWFKLWWFCRSQWSLLELSCFDSLLWNFCADFCA